MFNKFVNSVWLWMLMTSLAFAQLPDFTEMVKNNGDAVVNISTTQKAPELQMEPDQQQIPQDIPPELEDFFSAFLSRAWPGLCSQGNEFPGFGFRNFQGRLYFDQPPCGQQCLGNCG